MPIGVLEMNPAKPHPALSATPLSRSFASYLLLRNSLAEPLLRLLGKFFHGELPQIGSPGFMVLMIPQAGDTFELFGTPPLAKTMKGDGLFVTRFAGYARIFLPQRLGMAPNYSRVTCL
jgi:hypothetical protein